MQVYFSIQKRRFAMGRKNDNNRLNQIRNCIQNNPNKKLGWVAKHLGLDNKTVQRAVVQLEARVDLLDEDTKGRVSWFGKRK